MRAWGRAVVGASSALLLLLGGASGVDAATRVYYSVGTSAADLKAGAPTVTIASGTATFSIAQPANVGIGDEITYGAGLKAYISGRSSSTQYAVRTPTGAVPADVVGSTVTQIVRAFNSLSAAVAGSSNAAHLNTTSLVAADVQLNWPCYADGPLNDLVNVTGWTTGLSQFLRIYAPVTVHEVGASQRHSGRQGTGFRLAPVAVGNTNILNLGVGYVRVEGIEVDGSGVTGAQFVRGISVANGLSNVGDIRIDSSIIHDLHTTVDGFAPEGSMGVYDVQTSAGSGPPMRVSNNVIYDITNTVTLGHIAGIHVGSRATSWVYNNTVYNIINNPGCALAACGPAWGIYGKAWPEASGVIIFATNNYCGDVQGKNPVVRCYDVQSGAVLNQSHNVSSDATAAGTAPQINKNAYATYFESITAGAEDLHLRSNTLALWGSSGTSLASDPNLPVTVDIDGTVRARPDIGADESGEGCCALSVNDAATTLTVTGANRFEMRWNSATGGGVDQLFDLVDDPGKTRDLAGGEPAWNSYPTLFFDSIWYENFAAGAVPTAWYGWSAGDSTTPDSKLDLIEATDTRVKVRQEAFYHHSLTQGTYRLPGMKGFGDYSLYGVGRLALRWKRAASATVTWGPDGVGGDIGTSDLDWSVHKDPAVPSLNTWAAYRPTAALPPNTTGGVGSGADAFLLMKSNYTAAAPNVRADFLVTRYTSWADAQVSAHNDTSAGADKAAWLAWDDSRSTANQRTWNAGSSETFDFLTSFRPTNLVDHLDAAVTSRASDYTTPATITLNQGARWADADESTPIGSPTDFFNESEAAYLFDFDPALGLSFDMAATPAAPRYKPFLKVRRWRSQQTPSHVTMGGVALKSGLDYKAAVKPLARAWQTGDLSWHCTLQDASSCDSANIDVGGGVAVVLGGSAIAPARYGNGMSITTNDAYVVAPSSDFSMAVGAVDFWYRPNYDSTSGSTNMLWYGIGGAVTNYDCVSLQHTGGNLVFRGYLSADNENCSTGGSNLFTLTATAASYFWRAGDWVHVRAEWNSNTFVRLLVDRRVVASAGGFSVIGFDVGNVRWGSCQITCPGGGGSSNADGMIDEPHMYYGMGASGNPQAVGHAGLVGDGREALADAGLNIVLLTNSLGPGRKGEYLYLGADSRFRGLNVSLFSPGGGVSSGALVWQYWRDNGAGTEGWADLEGVTGFNDGTQDFTKSGTVSWNADPADWKAYSVNGGPDLSTFGCRSPATRSAMLRHPSRASSRRTSCCSSTAPTSPPRGRSW